MQGKQQNIQLELDFGTVSAGEARRTGNPKAHTPLLATPGTESRIEDTERLMEEIVQAENLREALRRVKANKGSPGVDGMTVHELRGFLRKHWPMLKRKLLEGAYQPKPVRRVEIPKPDGGKRKLGIPTVLDRFIQQVSPPALLVNDISGSLAFTPHGLRVP